MVVATLALFLSLAGVGWAASQIPANSVGTKQLRNSAVTAPKIARGAVGLAQVNPKAVQGRVTGTCATGTAISAVTATGSVHCNPVRLPQAVGKAVGPAVTLSGAKKVSVLTQALSAGSDYLVLAEPQVTITGTAGEGVKVDCVLAPNHSGSPRSRSLRVEAGKSGQLIGSIPLALVVPRGNAVASLSCTDQFTPSSDKAPTVSVQSGIEALQVNYVP